MEFFGITHYGPQNYIRDSMKPEYTEPTNKDDVKPLIEKVKKLSTLPANIERVDVDIIRVIDCYLGRVDGFAFGSSQRFNKMKRKGVIKPIGQCDMYRFPPTTSVEYGWWQHDLALLNKTWYKLEHRSPQPSSPNTLILDKVRKNNKYATLF